MDEAYAHGSDFEFPPAATALEKQLRYGRWLFSVFPFTDEANSRRVTDLRELGVTVAEQCVVAFAIGVFDKRRRLRAWEYAIEVDAPALAPPRPRRRRQADPAKLAATRKPSLAKKSKPVKSSEGK
jgi:hypothetical protein